MITYREASALDIPVLTSMEKILFPESPWSTAQFKEEFAGVPRTRYFCVATDGENIIGYAGVMVIAPGVEADILTVGVLDTYRKQGIGRAFMDQLEAWSIQREAPAMMLEVDVENIAAVALYKSLGYSIISTRKDYYGPSLDAFVMRKELVHA